ncbi:MAG TPA: phosphatase PAP2 family protein [Flavobacteriales bacterium]|nr:phosphatase PAP2 family protein [Flavobacteriales bacterium]HMR25911.1 phosphatase PAP2 family protein [Flavobacteriales bacterium]
MDRSRNVSAFVGASIVLALPAAITVWRTEQVVLHAAVNRWHAPWSDALFSVATHLADGLVPAAVAVILLFVGTWRTFFMLGLSTGLSAIVVQVLKRQVFADHDRPVMFAHDMPLLHLVDGVTMNHHFSFPSGHATCAFAMCLAFAVMESGPRRAPLWAAGAAMLAFSRVYLSQHFTEDVLAGAAVGVATGVLVWAVLYRSAWARAPWLDRRPWPTGRTR